MNTLHTSLKDTTELRKLIIDNPQLPLLIFANEDANDGDYAYMQADVSSVSIQELGLYNDELWLDKEDFIMHDVVCNGINPLKAKTICNIPLNCCPNCGKTLKKEEV